MVSAEMPQLRIYNSLTRTKDVFRPLNGNKVNFYICGPTVYDLSHMGHARAYLSFDIFRRVLSSYFKYNVLYVMNITDIDDKIIKRARQTHLYEQYLSENKTNIGKVLNDVKLSMPVFNNKFQSEVDNDKKNMTLETLTRVNAAVHRVEEALVKNATSGIEEKSEQLIRAAKDVLCEWLDHELGSTVTEMSVFSKLAKKFENDFFEDMQLLNVQAPDVVTRVSEYLPETLEFVQRIVDNGYAYQTSDGSVYFDTQAFSKSPNHKYAKLMPEAVDDKENAQKHLQESEGELSVGQNKSEKKAPADFALWKASKAGEPSWKSQFGDGRPGWHIECSAMSTAICGPQLDIHAGGSDLKFPHHDNEIAQCEAHFDKSHWVNYFVHCGALRIEGLKMSKSLKNFITIKEALKTYTSRQIRLFFLMHNIFDCLDYSTQSMERALQFEKFSNEFFLNVKDLLRRNKSENTADFYRKYTTADLNLLNTLSSIKADVHEALCDSVDTRLVVEKMRELINASNIYIKDNISVKSTPNAQLLKDIAEYLTSLLKIFGAIPEQQQLGYPAEDKPECSADRESILMPHLEALADFRSSVRNMAREHKNTNILQECDRLRDDVLPKLGVRFEDGANHTSVKLVDPEILIREQEQKRAIEEAKRADKERKQHEKEERERQKELARQIPPDQLFKQGPHEGKFSQFDANGLPTHDSEGKEVSKGQRKKLEKMWQDQKRLYEGAKIMNGN